MPDDEERDSSLNTNFYGHLMWLYEDFIGPFKVFLIFLSLMCGFCFAILHSGIYLLNKTLYPRQLEALIGCYTIQFSVLGMMYVLQMILLSVSVTTTILLPGMKHHGLLEKYFAQVMVTVSEKITRMKQKKN